MTRDQVKWMEQYLLPLKNVGLVEPEEERHQWVFHVAVSGSYTDWRESRILAGEQPDGALIGQPDEVQDDATARPVRLAASTRNR